MGRLKRYLPDYEKGSGRAFADTKSRIEVATARAKALARGIDPGDDDKPYTGIVDLVDLLCNLKAESK